MLAGPVQTVRVGVIRQRGLVASNAVMKDAIVQARQLHRKEKYGLALEILRSNTREIGARSLSPPKYLTTDDLYNMLDLRADLLVKESHLHEGLEDATSMVRMQPKNPRGYLRLGQIYLLLDKAKEAADTYRQALKRISPTEDCYKMLVNLQKKANRKFQQSLAMRCDPLEKLPRELLYLIFSRLNLEERSKLTLVSKKWRVYILKEPKFWNNIQLRLGKKQRVSSDTLIEFISRSTLPLKLDLLDTTIVRPERLLQYISFNKKVQMNYLALMNSSSLSTQPLMAAIRERNAIFPNLRVLKIPSNALDVDLRWCLQNLPALETLELTATAHCAMHSVEQAELSDSNLKTLKLYGGGAVVCVSASLASQLSSLSSLHSLSLHRVIADFECLDPVFENEQLTEFGFTAFGARALRIVMPEFKSPLLKSLALNNVQIDFSGWRQKVSLEYLELKWANLLPYSFGDILNRLGCEETLKTLVAHRSHFAWPISSPERVLVNLDTFQFTEMAAVDDQSLSWLLHALRHVKRVNVDSSEFSGPALMKLVRLGITHLRCKECPMSYEFLEWLQKGTGQVNVRY